MRLPSFIACAALMVISISGVVLAAETAAAPPSGQTAENDPLQKPSRDAMRMCAEFWTIKDPDEVDAQLKSANHTLDQSESYLKRRLEDELPGDISLVEEKIATLKKSFDSTLAKAVEDLAKTGVEVTLTNTKDVAKFVTSNATNDASILELRKAQAELSSLERALAQTKAAYDSIGALRKAVAACAVEQQEYLGKPETKASIANATSTPVTTMLGRWKAKCGDETGGFEMEGPLALAFTLAAETDQEGTVTGTLQLGEDAIPLAGIWLKDAGTVTANAKVAPAAPPWAFSGTASEHDGQFIAAGTITGKLDETTPCNGSFNGQEQM